MIRWSLGLTALAVAATLLFCWLWIRSEKHAALLEQELSASRTALMAQEQAMATLKTENERIMQEARHREQALRHIATEGDLALPELLRRLDGLLDQLPAAGAASGKPAGAMPAGAGQP